jgi:hypothetical protein
MVNLAFGIGYLSIVEGIATTKNYGMGASRCSYSQIVFLSPLSLMSLFVVGHVKQRRENVDFFGNLHIVGHVTHLPPKLFFIRWHIWHLATLWMLL